MAAIEQAFRSETGIAVEAHLGASSDLARQIEQGAAAELFLSADEDWADYLSQRGVVDRRLDLLTNRLVVVVPRGSQLRVPDVAALAQQQIDRLALAGAAVPAGRYARQALSRAGIWEQVKDRVLDGTNVRATLAYVERGEAAAGLVYATDAAGDESVRVVLTIPDQLHQSIRYPLVLIHPEREAAEAQRFFDYLRSPLATDVFRSAGFGIAENQQPRRYVSTLEEPATFLGLASADWLAIGLSVRTASLAVALSLPFGIALGWLLARKSFAGKTLVETAVNLPLVLPPVVTGYLLLIILGKRGLIGGWLHSWFGWEIALTWRAVVVALAVMGFPLLVRAVRLAFQSIDPRLFQAARSLGATPLDAFFSISLPLARSGVLAGIVLAFARGLGEFGATLIFAGNQEETRTVALQLFNLNSLPGAGYEKRMWALVAASVIVAGAALAVSEYLERRGQRRESA
jgi:molybdate transport system permease protein